MVGVIRRVVSRSRASKVGVMRVFLHLSLIVACAGGCRHAAGPGASYQRMEGPGVSEEPCPPGELPAGCDESTMSCPRPESGGDRSILGKCFANKQVCRTPIIQINVPQPKVIVRREEREPVERTRPARTPKPGNEVMLIPTTVYVPYAKMTPTGPATMVPLNMTPGPVPVNAPPPCNPVAAAPPPCSNPPASGAPACQPAIPPSMSFSANPSVEDLNRRCTNLENKIDTLIDVLSKNRGVRADSPK